MNKLITAISASLLITGIAQADQVILDDLIVDGSNCVGQDCVNGESFGFDTIRLKENNLRIRAFDTSSTSSFPTRDWQITFNDSANGGAQKFSIDDIDSGRTPFTIEGNAPSHSLYVDDGGRLGLGTSTPVVDLHVKSGNTPTLRLEQDGSSGFTPQTWDVAANEANFFIRDATNGSTLPFRIQPGAPSNAIYIENTGDIGFGVTNPNSGSGADRIVEVRETNGSTSLTLDYNGTNKFGELTFEESDAAMWSAGAVANNDFFYIFNYGRSSNDLVIQNSDGNIGLAGVTNPSEPIEHSNGALLTIAGVWQDASSRDLKHDIEPLMSESAKSAFMSLEPVTYRYNADPSDQVVGFVAEDVPDLVATSSRKTLSSMDIVAVMAKVVQEQEVTINELRKSVEELKSK